MRSGADVTGGTSDNGSAPSWSKGGLARELPSHTSKPASYAAKALLPATPLETQPSDVSKTPCMKNTTSFASGRGGAHVSRNCLTSNCIHKMGQPVTEMVIERKINCQVHYHCVNTLPCPALPRPAS